MAMDVLSGAPARLGKYEIRGTLGRGAMGIVYDGWDPAIGRRVAIKTVPLLDQSDPDAIEGLQRFKREAQAAGRLSHPNIVGVYDYGETDTAAYIVMEFIDGQSLKERLDAGERFSPSETVRILSQMLAGLQFSHDAGVVHRDVKPGNVMLTRDGRVKLADFGIARIESSTMTQDGTVLGTPAYMSPEQLTAQSVDARSDLYAAGVVLYQLLAGERPFEGGLAAITHKVMNTVPPRPSDISIAAPPALDPVVAKAMSRRPADRYPSADAFARALAAADEESKRPQPEITAAAGEDATQIITAARPPKRATPPEATTTPAPAKQGRAWLAGAALAVLLLAAGGGWYALHPAAPPDKPADVVVARTGPTDTRPADTRPVDTRPADTRPADTRPADTRPVDTRPTDTRPTDTRPTDTRPPDTRPVDTRPPDSRPPDTRPVDTRPPDTRPVDTRPVDTRPPDTSPTGTATTGTTTTREAAAEPVGPVKPPTPPDPTTQAVIQTPVGPDPAVLREGLAALARSARCALPRLGLADDGRVDIAGLVGAGAPSTALRDAVRAAVPGAPLAWSATAVDALYCETLDVVRPIARPPGTGLDLTLKGGALRLRDLDPIAPILRLPDYAAHLQVDYLSSDGSVAHLYPLRASTEHAFEPDASLALPVHEVGPPFGTDMIIAVASSVPLFTPRRLGDDDRVQTYLPALQAAIEAARRRNARVEAKAIALETVPR
jgi:serine/threonine-protein kinase